MRRFAAGVTLVTFNENGKLGGLTVSSFCSLSMDPPLVLICIDRKVASHKSLEKTSTFGVNICNSEQGKVAWDFANPKVDKNELVNSLPHQITDKGTPLLEGCLHLWNVQPRKGTMEETIPYLLEELNKVILMKTPNL